MSHPTSRLLGCIPIVVTPFTPDGRVDEAGLRREVEYLVTRGVHGLATLAIASEGYKLTEPERDRVARIVVETAAGRAPVVIGADHAGTEPAVERAIAAAAAGAAALMVLPPYFVKPDSESLRRYYRRIAAAVDLPVMVQDIPQLTGVALPATFLARLQQEAPNINYVKIEGTPAGPKTAEILRLTGGQMGVFAGWGGLSFWDGLLRGACGCMPGPNFGPDLAQVYDLFTSGDRETARKLFNSLVPFISWSMQSVDLSVWTAKESFVRQGIFASAAQRDPVTLPDAVDQQQFEAFFTG